MFEGILNEGQCVVLQQFVMLRQLGALTLQVQSEDVDLLFGYALATLESRVDRVDKKVNVQIEFQLDVLIQKAEDAEEPLSGSRIEGVEDLLVEGALRSAQMESSFQLVIR